MPLGQRKQAEVTGLEQLAHHRRITTAILRFENIPKTNTTSLILIMCNAEFFVLSLNFLNIANSFFFDFAMHTQL